MEKNKKELVVLDEPVKGTRMVDQNYLNNGGHDEYILLEIQGYKSMSSKYCVIKHDIYGKAESTIMTEEEFIQEFGTAIKNEAFQHINIDGKE